MKIKSMEKTPTPFGVPYDEGYAETIDPKTGADVGDLAPGSVELYPVNVVARDAGTSHDGDMGRLGETA
jgi:hypothetical protein